MQRDFPSLNVKLLEQQLESVNRDLSVLARLRDLIKKTSSEFNKVEEDTGYDSLTLARNYFNIPTKFHTLLSELFLQHKDNDSDRNAIMALITDADKAAKEDTAMATWREFLNALTCLVDRLFKKEWETVLEKQDDKIVKVCAIHEKLAQAKRDLADVNKKPNHQQQPSNTRENLFRQLVDARIVVKEQLSDLITAYTNLKKEYDRVDDDKKKDFLNSKSNKSPNLKTVLINLRKVDAIANNLFGKNGYTLQSTEAEGKFKDLFWTIHENSEQDWYENNRQRFTQWNTYLLENFDRKICQHLEAYCDELDPAALNAYIHYSLNVMAASYHEQVVRLEILVESEGNKKEKSEKAKVSREKSKRGSKGKEPEKEADDASDEKKFEVKVTDLEQYAALFEKVEHWRKKAFSHYHYSARLKHPQDLLELSLIYLKELPQKVNKDEKDAAGTIAGYLKTGNQYMDLVLSLNYGPAYLQRGLQYEHGVGVKLDSDEALEHFRQALLLGCKEAVVHIGRCIYRDKDAIKFEDYLTNPELLAQLIFDAQHAVTSAIDCIKALGIFYKQQKNLKQHGVCKLLMQAIVLADDVKELEQQISEKETDLQTLNLVFSDTDNPNADQRYLSQKDEIEVAKGILEIDLIHAKRGMTHQAEKLSKSVNFMMNFAIAQGCFYAVEQLLMLCVKHDCKLPIESLLEDALMMYSSKRNDESKAKPSLAIVKRLLQHKVNLTDTHLSLALQSGDKSLIRLVASRMPKINMKQYSKELKPYRILMNLLALIPSDEFSFIEMFQQANIAIKNKEFMQELSQWIKTIDVKILSQCLHAPKTASEQMLQVIYCIVKLDMKNTFPDINNSAILLKKFVQNDPVKVLSNISVKKFLRRVYVCDINSISLPNDILTQADLNSYSDSDYSFQMMNKDMSFDHKLQVLPKCLATLTKSEPQFSAKIIQRILFNSGSILYCLFRGLPFNDSTATFWHGLSTAFTNSFEPSTPLGNVKSLYDSTVKVNSSPQRSLPAVTSTKPAAVTISEATEEKKDLEDDLSEEDALWPVMFSAASKLYSTMESHVKAVLATQHAIGVDSIPEDFDYEKIKGKFILTKVKIQLMQGELLVKHSKIMSYDPQKKTSSKLQDCASSQYFRIYYIDSEGEMIKISKGIKIDKQKLEQVLTELPANKKPSEITNVELNSLNEYLDEIKEKYDSYVEDRKERVKSFNETSDDVYKTDCVLEL